jgi:hypothetical protein
MAERPTMVLDPHGWLEQNRRTVREYLAARLHCLAVIEGDTNAPAYPESLQPAGQWLYSSRY